jgi:hypothetical protein
MKKNLLTLFEPGSTPEPDPAMALRLLATQQKLPSRCRNQACRRGGQCQAEQVGTHRCADLWTNGLYGKLGLVFAGMKLSALCARRRDAAIHAQIAQALKIEPKPATGRRKKRSA